MDGYSIGFMVVFGWYVISDILNRLERNKLLNRLMAKNYQEFEYYDKKYEKDLKEVESLRDESRRDRTTGDSEPVQPPDESAEAERIIAAFEEDWGEGEVDKTKVTDVVK